MPELVVSKLRKSYGSRRVLDELSFSLETDGRIYGLFGPNGVGKTTLFRCLLGLESFDAERVTYNNDDLSRLAAHLIAKRGITMMFQRPVALDGVTVEQHLALVLEQRLGAFDPGPMLTEHGIEHLAHSKVADLSFGEAKLVDFVRVMALSPELLLLDEPFSGMDPLHVTAIKDRVRAAAPGRGVLLTDHNLQAALPFVDYAFVLYGGRLLFAGEPQQVRQNTEVRGLYLGDET